jgi:hypothetical protein
VLGAKKAVEDAADDAVKAAEQGLEKSLESALAEAAAAAAAATAAAAAAAAVAMKAVECKSDRETTSFPQLTISSCQRCSEASESKAADGEIYPDSNNQSNNYYIFVNEQVANVQFIFLAYALNMPLPILRRSCSESWSCPRGEAFERSTDIQGQCARKTRIGTHSDNL